MCVQSAALDNSQAERVNGILKEEYLHNYEVNTLQEAQKLLKKIVERYIQASYLEDGGFSFG